MNNAIICKMTIEQKRQLLDSAKGHFFSVDFEKKDRTIRHMNCKKWMEKSFSNGSKNAAPSTLKDKPEYYLAVDIEKGEFRAVNLSTMLSCKVNGKIYKFDKES